MNDSENLFQETINFRCKVLVSIAYRVKMVANYAGIKPKTAWDNYFDEYNRQGATWSEINKIINII